MKKIVDEVFFTYKVSSVIRVKKDFQKNSMEGELMKKACLSLGILGFLVLSIAVPAYSWQGRMVGMGDPFGLVQDESDFLIHPAGIAQGQGVKFYGDYRFTYTGVTDWDIKLDRSNTAGTLVDFFHFDTSGHEYKHNALVGTAFPFGGGRMGLFFTYDGMRGDYDGNEDRSALSNFAEFDLTKNLDNFALRLLYGRTVGGTDVGLELGMARRDEQQETWWNQTDMLVATQNYIWSFDVPERSLFPFMIPYDSKYWELLWKIGMAVKLAPLTTEASLRGGAIVSSDNDYRYLYQSPLGSPGYNADMNGDVTGWRIGSDIWTRYPGGGGLTFPFLFSFDYAEKKRDGSGIGTGPVDLGLLYAYTHKEHSLDLKAGGGVEKKFGATALLAAGIYYNYLRANDDIRLSRNITGISDNSDFPFHREHRVILRLAGEKEFSPILALRMGLNFFYGWVDEEFKFTDTVMMDKIPLDGSHWGIGASLGGTIKIPPITLEPFINGGWQKWDLDGDGETSFASTITNLWDMDKLRKQWSIGGGFSITF
jgi:hypothetical protein